MRGWGITRPLSANLRVGSEMVSCPTVRQASDRASAREAGIGLLILNHRSEGTLP